MGRPAWISKKFTLYIISFIIVFAAFGLFPKVTHAAIQDWQKGFTLHLNNQSNSEIDVALQGIKDTGANYVTFSPGWLTDNKYSTNVYRKSGTTKDDKLVYAIRKAKSLGLKVMLKPHLDRKDGGWRAFIDPSNKEQFFKNYSTMILGYANIAQAENVEQLAIGAELYKLSTNPSNEKYWDKLILDVRQVYNGDLTYSANSDPDDYDEHALTFWDGLDYWGASMYIGLGNTNTPSKEYLLNEWKNIETNYILPRYYQAGQKPLLITEIGYRSVDGAAQDPEKYSNNPPLDLAEQNLLYETFFEFWKDKPYMTGVHFWEWEIGSDAGGSNDKDYTPQGKPAEDTVKVYFNSSSTNNDEPENTENTNEIETETDSETPTNTSEGKFFKNINRSGYSISTFNSGTSIYTDRSYTVTTIPDFLKDGEIIRTQNSDKNSTGPGFLTFELIKTVDLYVAYDSRASSIPDWLKNWENTGHTIETTDTTFDLYRAAGKSGEISLAGNQHTGASGASSNYFVVASDKTYVPLSSSPSETNTNTNEEQNNSEESQEETQEETENNTTEEEIVVSGGIEVAHPENGQLISGEKKLKFFIDDVDPEDYDGFYDIEGDGEGYKEMDNAQDYKQEKVQFDDFTWNGDGPYKITFMAKNKDGSLIGTKTIEVYIRR